MTKLRRELSAYGLTMIVIGTLIGSGIYLTPSQIAGQLSSPYTILLVWCAGGLIALAGAFTFAELGSMFPKTGGVYVYLKEAYGPLAGFLFGWISFTIVMTGIIAALAIACTNYLSFILPLSPTAKSLTAVALIAILTLINIFRVKVAEMFTNIFTGMKLVSISCVILAGLIWGSGEVFQQSVQNTSTTGSSLNVLSAFGLALIGVLWSFGGWQHVTYLSGEAKNPQKNVPLAIVLGVMTVIAVYMLTNVSYMRLLTVQEMIQTDSIAADAVSKVIPFGGIAIAVIIILSVFATTFIYILTTPRIYFAMALDGMFFKSMARVHPKHNTPANAIIIQSLWATMLVLVWGSFEAVITYVVFIGWLFIMITAFTVFIFRIKRPDAPRPYRTVGYPLTPIAFIIALVLFILNTLIRNPFQAGVGIALTVLGLPFYFYFRRKKTALKFQLEAAEADT